MSQKRSTHSLTPQKGDSKLKENIIRKLYDTFQDNFDLALIASVAHTCQWDIQRATEALVILSGRKDSKKSKNSKTKDQNDGTKNKAKSLPGTLKPEKSERKGLDCSSSAHYSSTNSLSSGQVWQRHYKSKPQSPGLLTMIPPHSKEVTKIKAPSSNRSSFKTKEIELKKASAVVKRIQQYVQNGVKVMVLMRGVPGSGKTHLAQITVSLVTGNEFSQHIMSTDDYFIMLGRGNYAYDYNQLPQAHNWNQKRVSESLKRGINPVVVDNTNTQAWEMQPYVTMAVEHGYLVEVLEPVTEWRNKEAELAKRNIHSVPREKIRQMLDRYEPGWTGEELIKSFGLKYKQPGSGSVQEIKRPTNSLLAQHRQHGTITMPEKPKRKKNNTKRKAHHSEEVKLMEDKEKELEELNKFFAEYGKTMDPVSKKKVLESGVPISEVLSRMRKLQGNILPLPQLNIPPNNEPKKFNDITLPLPSYSDFQRPSGAGLPERDIVSSSNASETSECETDTDAELPKWNKVRPYSKHRPSGHFVNGKHVDDEDEDGRYQLMYPEDFIQKDLDPSMSCKQDDILSLIDFDTCITPISFSQERTIATPVSVSQDDLSLLNFDGTENTISRNSCSSSSSSSSSSTSSQEQETQMLSLQESLREVLFENNRQINELSVDSYPKEKHEQSKDSTNTDSQPIEVDLSNSLINMLGRRYEKSASHKTDEEPEVVEEGGVSINESLLQILVKKYSSDKVEEPDELGTAGANPCKRDGKTSEVKEAVKSPDLEGVPLPCLPPDGIGGAPVSCNSLTAKVSQNEICNSNWPAPTSDKFDEIVNSWDHTTNAQSKPGAPSPKDQRRQNCLLGAIKRRGMNTRDKSPDEVLRSVDLSWSSVPFTSSWEDVAKRTPDTDVQQMPKPQRRSVSKRDSWTNTRHSDFELWKANDVGITKVIAHSRNINQNYREPEFSGTPKCEVLMLDKGSMTSDTEEVDAIGKESALDTLSGMFPDISKEHLIDIYEKCKCNLLWTIEVLLETPQNLANIPQSRGGDEISSNPESKVVSDDTDYISLHNVAISDGKKTIKRRKDRKSTSSELSLLLKKQIEESVQINEDFYQDKTLFLKKLRHGEIEFGDGPIEPVMDTSREEVGDKFSEVEDEEDEEEDLIPMKMDPEFFKTLTQLFGPTDEGSSEKHAESISPVINIPLWLAQQLYECWVESMNKQVEDMQKDYVKMVTEDELLAKAFQEQEFEYRQPDLREIMDMELAMLLYKQNQAHLHEPLPETIATKLSKQLLFEAYPNMDRKMLLDLFESEGRSFQKTIDILKAEENQSPITVVAPDFLKSHGNKLIEQAKSEKLKKNVDGAKKPIIMVKSKITKKTNEKDVLLIDPIEYRQKTAQLHRQRNECCRLAQEAFRKKSFSVASYFSHIASLYKEQIRELSKEPFSSIPFDDKINKSVTKIDLHFLLVSEALQILDLFLDHHIKELRRKGSSSVAVDLITGRGQHSFNGKSKIKPAVVKRLEYRQINFAITNPGMLKAVLRKNDLLSTEM